MTPASDLALVVNPTSGRGKAGRLLPEVSERLRAAGASVEVLPSKSAAHATELAREAAGRHPVVVAMGGDGLVHSVANGLAWTPAAMGLVPTGSGNDFAVHLGYPRRDALAAAASLPNAQVRAVDVGRVSGGPAFVCVASAGFDSEANREANRIKWARGTAVYVVAVFKTLSKFRPARFRIVCDGETEDRDGMFVAVANANAYGGGMRIAPGAVLDDGLFDVVSVGAMSRATLLRQFPKIFRGSHIWHPAVQVRRAREVRIEADRELYLYADGEEIGRLPVTLSIEPAALRVLAPRREATRR